MISRATKEKDDGTEQKDRGRKGKCKIKTMVLRGVVGD